MQGDKSSTFCVQGIDLDPSSSLFWVKIILWYSRNNEYIWPKTGIHIFCIPVCFELDLKKAAKAVSDKSIELIPVKELLSITGYIRGGCSPIAMKKHYPTYIDETCQLHEIIAVSAGERGHQILLDPLALAELVHAQMKDIIA